MTDFPVTSVGEMLRSAREGRKLSLDTANERTKISIDVLRALEHDDFDSIESDIYLKGFLRSYAGFLDLDVNLVLKTLDKQRGGGANFPRGAMWDIEEAVKEERLKSPKIFRRFVLPLLFIVIIILTYMFVRERRKVQRLTPSGKQSYLQVETTSTRAT